MEIVTITEARRRLDGALPSYKAKIEYVTPDQALGRITARDITAAHAYPPYRKSPFDGYAIHAGEYLALLDGKLLGSYASLPTATPSIVMKEPPMKSWPLSAPASSTKAPSPPDRQCAS